METNAIVTFVRRLFHIRRTRRSFESPRYLLKWLLISTLIGVVAGIGAIVFYAAIHFATGTFLGQLVGYLPPDPVVVHCVKLICRRIALWFPSVVKVNCCFLGVARPSCLEIS